jgi:bis(5'-nucleosidyl)-tetraphosphatase
MGVETCAGGIIFIKEGENIFYLIIKGKATNWWSFPKGHLEENETIVQAAQREIYEETGLKDLRSFPGFLETISFINHKNNKKHVHHLLFQTKLREIILSDEHIEYKWLKFEEAYELIDHENQKRILKLAKETLEK